MIGFISDMHIGAYFSHPRVLDFIREWEVSALYIVGDGMQSSELTPEQKVFIKVLQKKAEKGVKITYLVGNHDDDMGSGELTDWRDWIETQINHHNFNAKDKVLFSHKGKRILVLHGHTLQGDDSKFSRFVSRIFTSIQPILGKNISYKLDILERKLTGSAKTVRENALKFAYTMAADVVVCGHTHIPELSEHAMHDKKIVYVNTGNFLKTPTYVTFNDSINLEEL